MPVEKSAGAVIFTKNKGKTYYLLLQYQKATKKSASYWDFPKGHLEKGEKEEEAAKREIEEETGLKSLFFVPGFKEWIKYFFRFDNKNILKFVTFFLAESHDSVVKISGEHTGYRWLPFQEAMELLGHKNAKNILQKANEFLEKSAQ